MDTLRVWLSSQLVPPFPGKLWAPSGSEWGDLAEGVWLSLATWPSRGWGWLATEHHVTVNFY